MFPRQFDMRLESRCILHMVLARGVQYLCCLILPHLGFCQCNLSCLPVRGRSKQSSLRSQALNEAREMQVRSSYSIHTYCRTSWAASEVIPAPCPRCLASHLAASSLAYMDQEYFPPWRCMRTASEALCVSQTSLPPLQRVTG